MATTSIKVITSFSDRWGDEIRILDIDGTLYREENGERTPMRFNTHDGGGDGPDGDILNHENVKLCGWEVEEDGNRNFCSMVVMPSDCFNNGIEQEDDLDEDAIEAIKDWAEDDLEIADKAAEENLKPLEREGIEDDFTEWLHDKRKTWILLRGSRYEKDWGTFRSLIEDYTDDLYNNQRGFVLEFHEKDEVLRILAEILWKAREYYPFSDDFKPDHYMTY